MYVIKNLDGEIIFEGADLENANLRGADLRGANLENADLRGANLENANLRRAYLRGAYLREAYLRGANLEGASLEGANLEGTNLRGAYLREANLEGANLEGTNLRGAYLRGAYLRGAYLRGADLRGAKNVPESVEKMLNIIPAGEVIGYKKLKDGTTCKLLIPAEAKRSSATTRKCRAEHAIVLEGEGNSSFDPTFVYRVGETVKPTEEFCADRWDECASGIHFFLTREEAERY